MDSLTGRLRSRGLAELAKSDSDELWLMCDVSDLRKPYADMLTTRAALTAYIAEHGALPPHIAALLADGSPPKS